MYHVSFHSPRFSNQPVVLQSTLDEERKKVKKKTAYYPVYQSSKASSKEHQRQIRSLYRHIKAIVCACSHIICKRKRNEKGEREREKIEEKAIHITDTQVCMLASLYFPRGTAKAKHDCLREQSKEREREPSVCTYVTEKARVREYSAAARRETSESKSIVWFSDN